MFKGEVYVSSGLRTKQVYSQKEWADSGDSRTTKILSTYLL